MLFINSNTPTIDDLSKIHFQKVKCLIRKRVGSKIKCVTHCNICKSDIIQRTGVSSNLRKILEDETNLELLILSKPQDLKKTNKKVFDQIFNGTSLTVIEEIEKRQKKYSDNQKKEESKRQNISDISPSEKTILKTYQLLPKIIDYNDWFNKLDAHAEYGPYTLAKGLSIRSCTYCNRQYTITVESKINQSGKLTRPQFDHWISKDKHPLLGLSFYNLIPSCPTCNSSVKGSSPFEVKTHAHPYLDDIINNVLFSFEYWATIGEYKIIVESNHPDLRERERINNTLKSFKIEEVYNGHIPELDDLIQLAKAYSPEYLNILKKSFIGANLTDEQIYRYAFGVELNPTNFHKRPLSKFKYDILKELGVIKKTKFESPINS